MNTNYKMLVLDLDGTLLNKKKEIEKSTINILRVLMQKGCYVIFASGRRKENITTYVNELYCDKYSNGWYVCCDGCYIYNLHGEMIHRATLLTGKISYELCKKMKNSCNSFACYTDKFDYIYLTGTNRIKSSIKSLLFRLDNSRTKRVNMTDLLKIEEIEKIVIQKKIDFTDEEYINFCQSFNAVRMTSKRIELQHKGINKLYAIDYLRQILGIQWGDICFIGDDENDRCVFQSMCYSVAMGNAANELKALANIVTSDNNNFGVEKFIKDNILRENQNG